MDYKQKLKASINFKFSFLKRSFQDKEFRLLDVGAGNHSASRIKKIFPRCEYYGLDLHKDYNNNEEDFALMNGFYELDLTKLNYQSIPDNYYDGIWMAHVIEHLINGDAVVAELIRKLKPGGFFYIEYPGINSTRLPSMRGTLNFYDDTSHVRLYSLAELTKVFTASNCTILMSGTRRNWFYIFAMPIRMVKCIIDKGHLEGNIFWDILGFAEFLYVQKKYN